MTRGPARAGLLALLLAVVAGLVAPALAVAAGPVPGQAPEDDAPVAEATDPFDRLASCVGAEGRLAVVLLVDESASLRETDPDDQRVAAARAALRSIDRLRGTDASGGSIAIDILVSTFSYDFRSDDEWVALTAESADEVDAQIAALADRDESMDTDFHNALEGARSSLAERAIATSEEGGGSACKAILLFTDGNFTLGARETDAQREQFGTTKDYAPGLVLEDEETVQEVTRLGVAALCEPGGVADQVRADNITLVSVPLGEGSALLEAMTTGQAGDTTCGDPATDTPGAYLPASDTQELLRTFDLVAGRIGGGVLAGEPTRPPACAEDPCAEGRVTFSVSSSLRRVHVFAAVPDASTRVVLAPPDGDAFEVVAGEDDGTSEVAGTPVTVATIADQAVTLDLEVPEDGSADGEWSVTLVGGEGEGLVQVITFTDLVATLDDTVLVVGGDGSISAVIGTRDGGEVQAEVRDPQVRATLTDPITGTSETLDLVGDASGFAAPYAVPADVTTASYTVTLRLEATTAEGVRIRSVSPEAVVPVRRPPTYPQVAPSRLELSAVEGDGVAEGTLLLTPAREGGGGCAWFDQLSVADAPEEAGELTSGVEGLATSADACTVIDGPTEVAVTVEAADRASGTVTGHVRIQLAVGEGEGPIPTDIPITYEMARGVDQAKRIALAVGLMVGGLVLPLALLVVVNLLTTRFQSLDEVRGARVPVVVTAQRQVLRAEGRTALDLRAADFEPLDVADGSKRRFTWGGLVFRARTPLNPFGEPYAAVSPEGGAADVAREGRRTDLALGLAGSWLFLLDPAATRDAPRGEVLGIVVAFAGAAAVEQQSRRLSGSIVEAAPSTAHRLVDLAGIDEP